jgi:general secretion pathway protein L
MAAAELEAEALAAKRRAAATLALSDELDRLTRGARVVARAKAESTSPVALLNALTNVLPDGTWLSHFALVAGEVVIEGWTRSSADLVGLLESSGLFQSVSYLSPVTREGERGLERFSFSARLGTR